jgi:hypothetical protein
MENSKMEYLAIPKQNITHEISTTADAKDV